MAVKYSKQRTAITTFLKDRKDHPTAEVIYEGVRKEYPNISLGTVYRNLMLLSDLGEIQRVNVGDGSEHFDPDTSLHNHFVCRQCGRVLDLEMDGIEEVDRMASQSFGGKIEGHKIYFHGVCEDCLKANSI